MSFCKTIHIFFSLSRNQIFLLHWLRTTLFVVVVVMSCLKAYTFKNNWHAFTCPLGRFISSWFTVSSSLCSPAINSLGQPPKESSRTQQSPSEIPGEVQVLPLAGLGWAGLGFSIPLSPVWGCWLLPWTDTGVQHEGTGLHKSSDTIFTPLGADPACTAGDVGLQDKKTRPFSSLTVLLLALFHVIPVTGVYILPKLCTNTLCIL